MTDKKPNEKTQQSNPEAGGEPSLFEEKPSSGRKRRKKLFLILIVSATAFIFMPKGQIKGEAVVQAERFTRMGLTSSGILKELLHRKGDLVKRGDLLVRFENPELSRKFEERRLTLEILAHDKTRLEKQVEFLQKDLERKTILFENGAIGRMAFEKAKLDHLQVQEELAMREKEIESVEGEVRYLKERVDSLEIRAPFDGMLLTDPGITVGNLLKEGDFVLELADPKSFFLEILVPEKEVEKVKPGNPVKARFRAFPWKTYTGEVTKVGPRTTEEIEKVFNVKHVIPCEIRLEELPTNLKYGMRAWLKVSARRNPRVETPQPPKTQTDSIQRLVLPALPEKGEKGNSHDNQDK